MIKAKFLSDGTLSEESIHRFVIEYISKHPQLAQFKKFIMHFPNEGKRSLRYGALMKALGMRKGVSDLFIALPRNGLHGAWIELKSENGFLSKEQIAFQEDMSVQGYYVATCKSIESTIKTIEWYLSS